MTLGGTPGHVFLVGFMGAGKSTVGALLAGALSLPFVDLDAEIERESALPVARIFAEMGEVAFRDLESAELAALSDKPPSVVACGGGIVLRDENRRQLKQLGRVVYLEVSPGEALARIGDVDGRPLLAEGGPSAAAVLLEARVGLYRAVADLAIETDAHSPYEIASEIASALGSDEETR